MDLLHPIARPVRIVDDRGHESGGAVLSPSVNREGALRAPNLAIIGVITMGLMIRVRYLWTHHLWNDELFTMRVTELSWSETFEYLRTIEPHPPASFLFIKVANAVFANQLTIDQLKYVILFWTVTIGIVSFWAVKRFPWLTLPVLAGLSVIAVNPIFAYLGSEVRPYAMLVAVAFALLWVSILWTVETNQGTAPGRRAQIAMAALLALAVWTQYAGVLLAVGVVVSIEMMSIVRRRTIDLLFLKVVLVAVALAAPVALFLKSQMSIDVPTATTPFPEFASYVGWGFGGLGMLLALGTIAAWFAESLRRSGGRESLETGAYERHELVIAGWYALTVVVIFFLGSALVWVVSGVQLANIGVSIIPVLYAVVGFACLLSALSKNVVAWLIVISIVISIPITLTVTDSPHILRPNRVSNVDIMLEASETVGFDHLAGFGTMLVSLDSATSNRYFAAHAESNFPSARIEPVHVTRFDTQLEATIEAGIADPEIEQIVLITRYGFDYRVRPYIPDGVRLIRVHQYAWMMEGAQQN